MKGYIGITSRDWFTYLSNNDGINEINFWRKNTNKFNALQVGEPFFFLVKNDRRVRGERAVLGYATYVRYEVLTVEEAWDIYRSGNGDENKQSFDSRMREMFGADSHTGEIGCIILTDFQVFDNPVYLSNTNVKFANSTMSGMGITEEEVASILEYGYANLDTTFKKLNELNVIGCTEDDEGFPEGKQILKQHLARERSPKVIKLAKEHFLQLHGKLICQVCGFDFKEQYGEIGEGYIEGHHTKPVLEMGETEQTMVEDIALVCSNCHRMLHRKRPWLTMDQLTNLLNEEKQQASR